MNIVQPEQVWNFVSKSGAPSEQKRNSFFLPFGVRWLSGRLDCSCNRKREKGSQQTAAATQAPLVVVVGGKGQAEAER